MVPTELTDYFTAERNGALLLIALAAASFGFAAYLLLTHNAFRAMAAPLVVLGGFQLAVGLAVALRTPAKVTSLAAGWESAPAATAAGEIERMQVVNRNFRAVKGVEVGLILGGLLLALLLPHPGTGAAIGLGLLVEASVLLAFDAFAHHRALVYTQWLQSSGP